MVFTSIGISIETCIPDFREGAGQGLRKKMNPVDVQSLVNSDAVGQHS